MKIKKGFTLVELLISLFIFASVVAIGLSAVVVGFASGNLTSESNKEINQSLNQVFQTISQKMLSANGSAHIVSGVSNNQVFGFNYVPVSNILVIATDDTHCTLFAAGQDTAQSKDVRMVEQACSDSINNSIFNSAHIISSPGIKITGFNITDSRILAPGDVNPTHYFSPYFVLQITATDAKGGNETTIPNAYSIPYPVVKNFN